MRTLKDRFNEEMKRPEFREAYQKVEQESYLALNTDEKIKEKASADTICKAKRNNPEGNIKS